MPKKTSNKEPLADPRQVRFPESIEKDLQTIADENHMEFVDVVRMAARAGLPVLKKRLCVAVKEAA